MDDYENIFNGAGSVPTAGGAARAPVRTARRPGRSTAAPCRRAPRSVHDPLVFPTRFVV